MTKNQLNNTDKTKKQKEEELDPQENTVTAPEIEKKGSYADSPADKARTHKGPIGIDRDPNSI